MQLIPYLTFEGQCEAAFKFYAEFLGGEIVAMIRHEGTPAADHVPSNWRDKIIHARLTVGDKVLMGSDAPPYRYEPMKGFSVTVGITDPSDAERIFHANSSASPFVMSSGCSEWRTGAHLTRGSHAPRSKQGRTPMTMRPDPTFHAPRSSRWKVRRRISPTRCCSARTSRNPTRSRRANNAR